VYRFLFRYLLAVGMAALSLASAAAQGDGAVRGVVTFEDSGAPAGGAVVRIPAAGASATTDAEGRFEIGGLAAGDYEIVVEQGLLTSGRRMVSVASGETTTADFRIRAGVQESVTVFGRTVGDLSLAGRAASASRLELQPIEIPATVDVVDSSVMEARGYQKVSDAVGRMAGVIVGEHATAPSSFSMRGFTGSQVAVLRDGIWLGPSPMVMRPQNTFNLGRVEGVRGPSWGGNGQGAGAGAVNSVTKSAGPMAATTGSALASYGSFNTSLVARGVTGPVSDTLWYRLDASRGGSDGYVERMDSSSLNLTGSILWRPDPRFRFKLSVDYLDDDLPKYFGTPLVPRSAAAEPLGVLEAATGEAIDGRMRFLNYNVEGGFANSDQTLVRADIGWDLRDGVTLNNITYGFDAMRGWQNAEGYVYCAEVVDVCQTVGSIQRYYGYFIIDHEQRLYGNRTTLNLEHDLGGLENDAAFGVEFSTLDFKRTRGFRRQVPVAPGDAVDPLNPVPGVYGTRELRVVSPTAIESWAVFVEDSLALTDRLRIAGGLRYDGLDLDRKNTTPTGEPEGGGFEREYRWWSWRAGAVLNLLPDLVAYGQFSNAKDPVSSNFFLVNSNQDFDLTDAVQWEVGVKADLDNGRSQLTLSWFDISRDDVLERFALDSVTNLGGIASQGFEFTSALQVVPDVRLGLNLGYIDSEFRASPNFERFAGNRPPNVPDVTAHVWASYENIAGLPLEIGASGRHVGERFANNSNQIAMKAYTLGDVYASWTQSERVRLTFRVDNVTDTVHAVWSDPFYVSQTDPSFLYSNQLMIGAPRSFSVTLQAGF